MKHNYEAVSELIVRDLFAGSPNAPRRKAVKKAKRVRKTVEVEPVTKKPPKHYECIECPCCRKPVGAPDLDVIIDYYNVPPLEQAILRTVWRGKGYPVSSERLFDAMYADDPDGGPTPTKMYLALKVALCRLRKRISGSGVTVETVGYGRGFRLIIEGK